MLHIHCSNSVVRACAHQDTNPRPEVAKQPRPKPVNPQLPAKSPWPASRYLANRWLDSVDANLQQRPVVGQLQRAATPLVALLLAPIDAMADVAALFDTKAK